jgi:PBP1b-binding outer membrane lipoprotein LpoB
MSTGSIISITTAAALFLGGGIAAAQTTTTPKSTTDTPAATTASPKVTLTEVQAKSWIDKPVYSSDNKQIGEVVAFKRGADNVVTEMHADIGGMLGMGESRVKLMPAQFKLQGDRVVLNLTQEQAKTLPKVES